MKLLELFSGTKSVGKVAIKKGFDVVSLDLKKADIVCNILEWNYTKYPVGYWDFIWASPPCQHYSRAKTVGERKIDEANKIVMRTIEIINYFQPKIWFIENPQTGLLKNQEFMKELPYKDVDYCKYGFNYRTRTRLWNNLEDWEPRPLCKKDCGKTVGKKHIETAQRLPNGKSADWNNSIRHTQDELYRIPEELIEEIINYVNVVYFR